MKMAGINTRSNRQALSEISRFVEGVPSYNHESPHTNIGPEIDGVLTPSPSPDELVIRARGRRRTPYTWSPRSYKILFSLNESVTPVKSPNKGTFPTRCSPRKRLHLETKESPVNTESRTAAGDNGRRSLPACINTPRSEISLETMLQALSREQLQNIVCKITSSHPNIKKEVEEEIPEPDLKPYEEELKALKKNILGARPRSRLTTTTDAHAYTRASTHLMSFKRAVTEQSKTLNNCQQWASLMEYCMMAWQHVKETPVWDNPPHNKIRDSCFKILSSRIMQSLKHATLNTDNCLELERELHFFVSDSQEIIPVLEFLKKTRQS